LDTQPGGVRRWNGGSTLGKPCPNSSIETLTPMSCLLVGRFGRTDAQRLAALIKDEAAIWCEAGNEHLATLLARATACGSFSCFAGGLGACLSWGSASESNIGVTL
jgi:hypothetical protein